MASDMDADALLHGDVGAATDGVAAAASSLSSIAAAGSGIDNSGGFVCRSEYYFNEMNQSLPILVAMCRGLVDDDGEPLINVDLEPWCLVRPMQNVRPKAKDYVREIGRRWYTFVGTHQNYKGGPRPKKWTIDELTDWLDKHPITDIIDAAYLKSKVQEAKDILIDGSVQLEDAKGSSGDGAAKVASLPSEVDAPRSARADTASFVRLSESIKWLGTSVLTSAKLFVAQREQDREMTIEENEKNRELTMAENEKDRKAQFELAKLEAEKREKEIADARARERINILRDQLHSLRKDKRQLTMEVLSENKRSKTMDDFLTVELRQMSKDIEQKEVELNNLLR